MTAACCGRHRELNLWHLTVAIADQDDRRTRPAVINCHAELTFNDVQIVQRIFFLHFWHFVNFGYVNYVIH